MGLSKIAVQQIMKIDMELNKIQDFDILLERVLLEARHFANADAGSIYVKEGEEIAIRFAHNDTIQKTLLPGEKQAYPHFSVPINDKSISGYVAMTGDLLNIPDVYNIPKGLPFSFATAHDQKTNYKTTSMLTVPLKTADKKILGVIQIINAMDEKGKVRPFTVDDENLVTHFAASATDALQRAYLTRSMIIRMIRLAELRDPKETGAHVNRVAGYSVEIYERWAYKRNIDKETIENNKDLLKLAAMLHDVGKVAISDTILKKPARFTPEEYEIMKTHTLSGAKLFDDPLSDLDEIARDVALTHHENWDGTGYPGYIDPISGEILKKDDDGNVKKRKGEEISLWGRIVAIADVYDALMSHRVYKEAWDEDHVLSEMHAMSGTKFDPELVDAFFEVLPRIKDIGVRHPG